MAAGVLCSECKKLGAMRSFPDAESALFIYPEGWMSYHEEPDGFMHEVFCSPACLEMWLGRQLMEKP